MLDAMFLFSLCLLNKAVLYSTLKFQYKCYWQFKSYTYNQILSEQFTYNKLQSQIKGYITHNFLVHAKVYQKAN